MTAPPMYQTGQPGQFPRAHRFQQGPQSAQGDGGFDANGMMSMRPTSPGQQNGMNQAPGAGGQRRFQTARPPAPQNGAPQGSAPPPTFAQMQANGQARPAPPPQASPMMHTMQTMQAPAQPPGASSFQGGASSGVSGSLNSAVQQALANPSAYGSQQVQDVYKMLTQNLGQDYDLQRQQLGEEMARRGLSDSTIAGQHYSDLATEQARAQANIATQLAQQAALTYGQDRNSAIQAGLGLGNLDLSQQLGLGNLGVAQQNANTGAQSVANQYSLGQGQLGISQQAQDLARQLGVGNLGISQGQLDLSRQLGLGNLGLQQQQLNQQGSQFQQSLALDQLKNSQQFGLQQADLTGNYNGQSTLASRAQQMAQQQFAQQLAQQLGIATMQDKTANRGIDVQGSNNINQLMMQLAMLGIGGSGLGGLGGLGTSAGGATGTGGAGGATSSTLPPAAQQFLSDPANERKDPRLFATLQLSNPDPNVQAYLNDPNSSVNFGGQQYSAKEYLQLMQQHPELFGVNTQANQNAAYNADWFKNSTMQSATPLPSDLLAQQQKQWNGQGDPNAPFMPQGNDYGFAMAGGHTLADWQAYQGSEQYRAMKWASEHPGQPYPRTTPVAPTRPEDTNGYETQRLLQLAQRLGLSPADVGLTNYDY